LVHFFLRYKENTCILLPILDDKYNKQVFIINLQNYSIYPCVFGFLLLVFSKIDLFCNLFP
jgi:hypothetical protein